MYVNKNLKKKLLAIYTKDCRFVVFTLEFYD